jgi:hypothetical protein
MTMLRLHMLIHLTNQHKGRHSLSNRPRLDYGDYVLLHQACSPELESTKCATIFIGIDMEGSY